MLYFDFYGYEGFKNRFGLVEHGNGEKSRRNKILLAFVKSQLHQAVKSGDRTLINISNMADLKKVLMERIQASSVEDPRLECQVNLLGYRLYSAKYETDACNGLCEDGDSKAVRYVNHDSNARVFKMKSGKFIRALILETEFGQSLPEQTLVFLQECFAQEWEVYAMASLPKNKLFVNDNFKRIYSSSQCEGDFHSCMMNKGYHTFYQDAVNASAAYLENADGKIIARCVIYNEVHEDGSDKIWRLAERQYATDLSDVLKRALIEALIREGRIDGYKQVGFDCHNAKGFVDLEGNSLEDKLFWIDCNLATYDTLSYQDSFKWYDINENRAYNDEVGCYDYCLDTTEGSIDGEDDSEEVYDEYHDTYGDFSLTNVLTNEGWQTCDSDWLDDFEHIQFIGWVHKSLIAICPRCGCKFVKDRGEKTEDGKIYCSISCSTELAEAV